MAKGPSVEELSPCLFPPSDHFPTSGISFPCLIRLFHTLASTLVFSNQNQKSETESIPKDQCQGEAGSTEEAPHLL